MLLTKSNVIVYTMHIDTNKVEGVATTHEVIELFKKEFIEAGMVKEAQKMDIGGYDFKVVTQNDYYTEYEIYITTRKTYL